MKLVVIAAASMLLHQAQISKPQELKVDPPVDVRSAFAGNTISVIVFRSHAEPVRNATSWDTTSRLIFHAFLGTDGRASVKRWDEKSDQWQAPVSEAWSVEGDRFCLSAGKLASGLDRMCMETIVWKDVFSGTSVGGADFMVKGNVIKGNPDKL